MDRLLRETFQCVMMEVVDLSNWPIPVNKL
jgi:hypothetical protein